MVDFVTPGALALRLAADPVEPAGALVADDPDEEEFLELLLQAAARPAIAARARPFFQSPRVGRVPPALDTCRESIEVPPLSGVRLCAAVDMKATDL
jgi:hypothetical protein